MTATADEFAAGMAFYAASNILVETLFKPVNTR
jgi:hypothetical protein